MIKISNENLNTLKDIIIDKKNKPMITDLVTKVIGLEIKDIEFDSIKKFENISEYQFSIIKTKCDIELENKVDIYFKVIKKDKIKESIFCYWCLLYEQALREKQDELTLSTIINKVVISEIGMERYKNSVFLEIKDNKLDILKNGTEIHFIDFIKYIEKHKDEENHLEEWLKYIDKDNEDILMIGVVLNKDIGRSNIQIV